MVEYQSWYFIHLGYCKVLWGCLQCLYDCHTMLEPECAIFTTNIIIVIPVVHGTRQTWFKEFRIPKLTLHAFGFLHGTFGPVLLLWWLWKVLFTSLCVLRKEYQILCRRWKSALKINGLEPYNSRILEKHQVKNKKEGYCGILSFFLLDFLVWFLYFENPF